MSTNATLRDVARLAGVSLGTASQALNNRANVLPETRARVLGAASSLGYSVRGGDKPLRVEPLNVIGMLTKHDLGLPYEVNVFFSHVQAGIENECRANNISLMYANVEVDHSNHPIAWPRLISETYVDGLILMGTFIEDAVEVLNRTLNKPLVLVDSYAPNMTFDKVEIDNLQGTALAMNCLLEHGHRDIGLIGWNEETSPDIHERREGYLSALRAHGIAQHYIEPGRMLRNDGYMATQRLLKRAPQITAIFAYKR